MLYLCKSIDLLVLKYIHKCFAKSEPEAACSRKSRSGSNTRIGLLPHPKRLLPGRKVKKTCSQPTEEKQSKLWGQREYARIKHTACFIASLIGPLKLCSLQFPLQHCFLPVLYYAFGSRRRKSC